jgi:Zn2+/Cd2+-exporting ATPase
MAYLNRDWNICSIPDLQRIGILQQWRSSSLNDSSSVTTAQDYRAAEFCGEEQNRTTEVMITGLDCANCAAKLEKRIGGLAGVSEARLTFATGKLTVEHCVPVSALLQAIQESGYRGSVVQGTAGAAELPSVWQERRTQMTAVSGVFLAAALTMRWLGIQADWIIPVYILSMVIGGFHVVRIALYSLKALSLDMNVLMTIAAVGAAAIGEWNEAAMVVFLFSLGNSLQVFSMDRTRRSVRSLMELAPQEALVIRDQIEFLLPVEALSLGDRILVKPGERIPMDGKVVQGFSSVDQASLTGESVPVDKVVNDEVFAGTLNGAGSLTVEVTRLAQDNTIGRIMHLVEEAQAQRAPSQQFVDVFARYYTPAVIAGAVALVAIPVLFFGQPFQPWFYKSLVLLVISCPCALVISTPVAIVSAIGSASRQGLLIKGGAYLEELGRIRAIAFDKTGTLTEGRLAVAAVIAEEETDAAGVLALAAAVERYSEHPAAQAIVARAKEMALHVQEADRFISHPGVGVKGYVGSDLIQVVRARELPAAWQKQAQVHQDQGRTVTAVLQNEKVLGLIALADRIRPGAQNALDGLRKAGISRMTILTGDNHQAATVVAETLGLQDVRAELLPEEKVMAVKELRTAERRVAMVGDGVNDAPALAAASVGIAMGAAGTDAALETADVALMADDLEKVTYGIHLGRKTLAIIKQNIVFSVGIKGVFLVLTLLGMANLWMAVFADTGAALLVIFNGMRLMTYKGN